MRIIFALLTLIPLLAQAQLAVDEFAAGFTLETQGDFSVYHLPLPEAVYRSVAYGSMTDLRVFNSDGEVVPHALRTPKIVVNEESLTADVPVFPIASSTASTPSASSLNISIADNGTLIRLSNNSAVTDPTQRFASYILDTSAIENPIQQLQFSVDSRNEDYLQAFRLEQSEDLSNWRVLVPRSTLVDMTYGDFVLQKDRLLLPANAQKYLRLVLESPADNIRLTAVTAHSTLTQTQSQTSWLSIEGTRSEEQQAAFVFDRGGLFTANRMDVVLPQDNTVLETAIYSRASKEANWSQRYQGTVYRLNVEGNAVQSDPFLVSPTQDRYWKMEVKTEGGIGQQAPQLRFAWTPNELYFLARGDGPFSLAFGNIAVDRVDAPIDILINALDEDQQTVFVGNASLGDRLNLRGAAALEAPIEVPWRQFLLWSILGLSVLVAGAMAYRLLKQMRAEG